MRRYRLLGLAVALLALPLTGLTQASDDFRASLTLSQDQRITAEGMLQFDIDPDGTAEFSGQLERARAGDFFVSEDASPHFGYTDDVIWFYLPVQAPENTGGRWFLEVQHPMLSEVTVRIHHQDGDITEYEMGQRVPFARWPVEHRNATTPLELEAGERAEIMYRIASTSSLQAPLVIWPEKAFGDSVQAANLWFGIFYGIIIGLLLYNLLLYIGLRDINYLYYVSYVGLYGLSQAILNGFAYRYFWPGLPGWAEISTGIIISVAFVSAILFSRSFLQLPQRMPWANRLVLGIIGIFILAVLINVAISPRIGLPITALLAGVNSLVLFGVALISLRSGFIQARYFLLAWTIFLLGTAVYGLRAVGVLPNVFLTEYGVQVGAVIQMLMLSFALAHRMRIVQWERAQVEKDAKAMLEKRVKERTAELDKTLGELSSTNERLEHRTRLFETLVEVNQIAPVTRDPETLLSRTLPLLSRTLDNTGIAVIVRAPGAPNAVQYVHFHNIEEKYRDRILAMLRGRRVESELPVKISGLGGNQEGLLITMHNRLQEADGLFLVAKVNASFLPEEREAATLFADHLGASMEAVLLQRRISDSSEVEESTGLYNRGYMDKMLHKEMQRKKTYQGLDYGVALIRIHEMEQIVKKHGNATAERMLAAAGEALQACCDKGQVLGRWRGDRLAIVCSGARKADMDALISKINQDAKGKKMDVSSDDGQTIDCKLAFDIGTASSDEVESVINTAEDRMRVGSKG